MRSTIWYPESAFFRVVTPTCLPRGRRFISRSISCCIRQFLVTSPKLKRFSSNRASPTEGPNRTPKLRLPGGGGQQLLAGVPAVKYMRWFCEAMVLDAVKIRKQASHAYRMRATAEKFRTAVTRVTPNLRGPWMKNIIASAQKHRSRGTEGRSQNLNCAARKNGVIFSGSAQVSYILHTMCSHSRNNKHSKTALQMQFIYMHIVSNHTSMVTWCICMPDTGRRAGAPVVARALLLFAMLLPPQLWAADRTAGAPYGTKPSPGYAGSDSGDKRWQQ